MLLLAFMSIKSVFTNSLYLRAALQKMFLSEFDMDTYLEGIALTIFPDLHFRQPNQNF